MAITMVFYTASHNKFYGNVYSDILFGIDGVDIMGCCTLEHSVMNSVSTFTW